MVSPLTLTQTHSTVTTQKEENCLSFGIESTFFHRAGRPRYTNSLPLPHRPQPTTVQQAPHSTKMFAEWSSAWFFRRNDQPNITGFFHLFCFPGF